MHQRFHYYIIHHKFLSGVYNGISDRPSRSQYLTNSSLLTYMDTTYPQRFPWKLWTPPSALVSTIASTLRWTKSPRDSPLVQLLPTMVTGKSGMHSTVTWSSTPYPYCTGIRSPSSMSLQGNTGQGGFPPAEVKYDSETLRTPYGQLAKRSPL